MIPVTPRVAGTVLAVRADDTDVVAAGTALVDLDPADARVTLDAAEADLARAVRNVRQLFASRDALRSTVANREADLAKAAVLLMRATLDDAPTAHDTVMVSSIAGAVAATHSGHRHDPPPPRDARDATSSQVALTARSGEKTAATYSTAPVGVDGGTPSASQNAT